MKKIISVFTSFAITLTLFLVFPADLKVSATENWGWPVPASKSNSTYAGHSGLDIQASGSNVEVVASRSGTVVYSCPTLCPHSNKGKYEVHNCYDGNPKGSGTYGNYIKLKHVDDNGTVWYSLYAHLAYNTIRYKVGDKVSQGAVLGYMGSSGNSTGQHLHFEIRNSSNNWLNPLNYVTPGNVVKPNIPAGMTISGQTEPSGRLEPGKFFGIYGIITSNPNISAVWGGVTYRNGDYVDGFYYQDFPNTSTYDLSKTFDNKLIFNNLPVGFYTYCIYGRDTNNKEYPLIKSDFQVGDPPPAVPQGHIMSENEGAGRTVPDGDYIIYCGLNQYYYLDVPGSADNLVATANVQMWINNDINTILPADAWTVTYLNNGFYSIKSKYNKNLSLDIANASLDMSTNVQIHNYHGGVAQQFSILPTDTGYKIQARCGAYCLDVVGAKIEKSTNVQVYEDNGTKSQRFVFVPYFDNSKPLENGIYTIKTAVSDGWYVDVYGNVYDPYKNSSNVQIWDGKTDMFYLETQGNGYYRIREITSGLYLEVINSNNTFANQAVNVMLYEKTSSRGQLWYLKKENNNYILLNQLSGYPLDMAIDKIDVSLLKRGVNLNQFTYHGKLNQQWQFERATLDSLSITAPNKTNYLVGQEIDTSGLSVKANFSNGMKLDVTKFVKYNYDNKTDGKKDVTVSYTVEGQTVSSTFAVNYENIKVSSLEITEKPTKLAYKVNDKIDTSGLKLKAVYNNGETKEITEGFEVSYDFSSVGKKEVTVTYEGKSIKYEVEVTYSDLKINLTDKTQNSIAIEWNEIETADGYKIEMTYSDDDGTVIKKKYNTTETNYKFENLESNDYTIRVSAYKEITSIEDEEISSDTINCSVFKLKVKFGDAIYGLEDDENIVEVPLYLDTDRKDINSLIIKIGTSGSNSSGYVCKEIKGLKTDYTYEIIGYSEYRSGDGISGGNEYDFEIVLDSGVEDSLFIGNAIIDLNNCNYASFYAYVSRFNEESIVYIDEDFINITKISEPPTTAEPIVTDETAPTDESAVTDTTSEENDVVLGDVNNDGKIDLKDVVLIRRYIVGGWDVEISETAADVNHDEKIDLKDVVLIRRYIVGGWDIELNK